MRCRGILVAGKPRGQIAIVLDRHRVVALQQVHISAGEERVGQPRAVGKPRLHLRDNLLLRVFIVATARQLHQQIKAPRAVLVGAIGQCRSLRHSQPLQLQLAGSFGDRKIVSCRRIQARLALQRLELLRRLIVPARVVIRVRQAAQFGDGQRRLGSRRRQLGSRCLRFRAQGMLQQNPLEGRFRGLLLAQRLLHFAFNQFKGRSTPQLRVPAAAART